jgi:ESS family glutamate:Na+ symporter
MNSTEEISKILVQPGDALMISIIVLFIGFFITKNIKILRENYIPPSVTGGILCSIIVALIYKFANVEINFDMQIRDILLLVFFSTIGLSAKFKTLVSGGKALLVLTFVAFIFLIIQNATGIGIALLFDAHPAYGLMAGSVSFAGGHGTAIAWGNEAEAAGLAEAGAVGIIFATFGLVAGGILGGPIGKRLITKNKLQSSSNNKTQTQQTHDKSLIEGQSTETLQNTLAVILVLAICVEIGHLVNRFLFAEGVLIPGFLTSMFVGIIITNLTDVFKLQLYSAAVDRMSDISLNIFLSMSLMSMHLWLLAGGAVGVMVALFAQMLVVTLFAALIVFRVMGRDYDAAVISSGFIGLGLGATPVAIANMNALTSRFGVSVKAFLVIPLVGAFFIDILNAVVIKFYINVISKWLM